MYVKTLQASKENKNKRISDINDAVTNFLAQLAYEKEHETVDERKAMELTWILTGKGHI